MRVISGSCKGRKLICPKILKIRPTTDRTKEFIFDYLGSQVYQTKILDLFSGTGNLGIEALSRGADEAYFVENDRSVTQVIYQNLQLTHFESQAHVVNSDVFKFLKWVAPQHIKFDLIFADPPYQGNLVNKLLIEVDRNNILLEGGIVIIEYRKSELLERHYLNLIWQKTKILGDTAVSFFIKSGDKN